MRDLQHVLFNEGEGVVVSQVELVVLVVIDVFVVLGAADRFVVIHVLLKKDLVGFEVVEDNLVVQVVNDHAVGIIGKLDTSNVVNFKKETILLVIIDFVTFVIVFANSQNG